MRRAFIVIAALVLAVGIAPVVAAQDPAPPQQQPSTPPPPEPTAAPAPQATQPEKPATQKVEGVLVSADATAKTITVKTADGQEATFIYTDQTDISGVEQQAAGLATAAGSKVTVQFTGEGASRTATKIKVKAKKTS
jgi:hypothetical protein